MAASSIKILTLSIKAAAALSGNRAVTAAGTIPAAGAACLGFSDFAAAIGERVSVGVMGTAIVEAGGAFAVGAGLELDGLGRVVARSTGVIVAHALAAASAAGSMIEVLVIRGTQAGGAQAVAPGAPTIGTLVAGDGKATANWTAPASDGGAVITGYIITPSVGSPVTVGNVLTGDVTVANGTAVTVTVAAINSVGPGPASAASNSVTPAAGIVAQSALSHNNVFAGNSLTFGTGALGLNGSYPSQLQRGNVINNASITNSGVPGQTTAQMRTGRATQIDQYYVTGAVNNLHLWEITNQLASTFSTTTAQNAWDQMKLLIAECIAANPGWKIILYTSIPRFNSFVTGWTIATLNQALLDANALMLSEGPSLPGVVAVVDLRQNSGFVWGGAGMTSANTAIYNADGVHCIEEGYAVIKASSEAVMKATGLLRVTPSVVPALPVLASYVEQSGSIRIKIAQPTGGGLVESYVVTTVSGTVITDSAVGTNGWDRTISGLTNGVAQQLIITPVNSVGNGPALTTAALTPKATTTQLYNFEADTVGNAPANVTAINGALAVSGAVTGIASKSIYMPAVPADSKAGIFDFANLQPQSENQDLRVTRVAASTSGSEATYIGIRLQDAFSTVAGMENYRLGYYLRIRGDGTLSLWRLDAAAFVALTGNAAYNQSIANVLQISITDGSILGRAIGGTILTKLDFTYPSGTNQMRIGILGATQSYHDTVQLVS